MIGVTCLQRALYLSAVLSAPALAQSGEPNSLDAAQQALSTAMKAATPAIVSNGKEIFRGGRWDVSQGSSACETNADVHTPDKMTLAHGIDWLKVTDVAQEGPMVSVSDPRLASGVMSFSFGSEAAARPVFAMMSKLRTGCAKLARQWGALASLAGEQLVGTTFHPSTLTHHRHADYLRNEQPELLLLSFEWLDPLRKMELKFVLSNGTEWTEIIELGGGDGLTVLSNGVDGRRTFAGQSADSTTYPWRNSSDTNRRQTSMPIRYNLPSEYPNCQRYRAFILDGGTVSIADISRCNEQPKDWHVDVGTYLKPYSRKTADALLAQLPGLQRDTSEAFDRLERKHAERRREFEANERRSRAENEALGAEMRARNGPVVGAMIDGASSVRRQNEEWDRQGRAAIADGAARGAAEYERRQAAERSTREQKLIAGQERGMAAAEEQRRIAQANEQRRAERERTSSPSASSSATQASAESGQSYYAWCYAWANGSGGAAGTIYASGIGSVTGNAFSGHQASFNAKLSAQGVSEQGQCFIKETQGELETFKARIKRDGPGEQWVNVNWTPSGAGR